MSNRVVVTGMGMISPLGLDVPSTWQGLVSGKSGVDYITQFDPEPLETKIAAEVKNFDPAQYMDRKDLRRMERFVHFAVAASLQAVEQSRLNIDATNAEGIGVVIGVGLGGLNTLLSQYQVFIERGADRVSPFLIPMMIADMASGQVAILLGAKGPNFCTTSSCASSSDAIGEAFEIVRRGDAQAMITGGSEAVINPLTVAGFNAARALSIRNHEPQKASRPFDAERDGFIMGEGAATLILESLPFATKRGALILAEVVGYGAAGDAYHITQPADGGEGGARSMRIALKEAGLEPGEIDYINAHGTSTPLNDKNETMAIKTVFGKGAYRIPISSTKSMVGHLLGAAGAMEAAISVLTIQNGVIPPTINLTSPDPDCDLDYVPNTARQAVVNTALSNVFGFGGHNSTLIIRRYGEKA
ncbi:MAG: beta-ketoacyl-[acyl-carrier-protein] synthase II [Dehalococcoidia bacterium]|nr:MAG: beta-ketoacyl-[acyl-carrier-protein] synthase II [Dehalococcoidia bacterium]